MQSSAGKSEQKTTYYNSTTKSADCLRSVVVNVVVITLHKHPRRFKKHLFTEEVPSLCSFVLNSKHCHATFTCMDDVQKQLLPEGKGLANNLRFRAHFTQFRRTIYAQRQKTANIQEFLKDIQFNKILVFIVKAIRIDQFRSQPNVSLNKMRRTYQFVSHRNRLVGLPIYSSTTTTICEAEKPQTPQHDFNIHKLLSMADCGR